jgi:hypothetical protein
MKSRKIFSFLLSFLLLMASAIADGAEGGDGEKLVPLQSGRIGDLSYALYRGAPAPNHIPGATTCDLILLVRNLGMKVMRLDELSKSNFVLIDTLTKDNVSFDPVEKPRPIRFGQSAVIHLSPLWWVRAHNSGPQTGMLTVRANASGLLLEDLIIPNIPLDSARVKK